MVYMVTTPYSQREFVEVLSSNLIPFALSLSKGRSWFDKLTTNDFCGLCKSARTTGRRSA